MSSPIDQRAINNAVRQADGGPSSATLPHADVHTIDVSAFMHDDGPEFQREQCVDRVLEVCYSLGFMNITGHGVPQALIDGYIQKSREFFSLPADEKQKHCLAGSATGRGYVGFMGESLNAVLNREGGADLKEVMDFGPVKNAKLFEPNIYASDELVPGYRNIVDAYFSEMERVEGMLYRIFSRALAKHCGRALPHGEQYLKAQVGQHRGMLRTNYYPKCPSGPSDVRCGAHTDWSPFTILYAEREGLEVIQTSENGQPQWRRVPAVPGCFTINVADQLHVWSNGAFKSSIHKVNASPSALHSRISVPYFPTESLDLTDERTIAPVCKQDETPRYPSMSIKGYLMQNFSTLQGKEESTTAPLAARL